MLELQDVPNFRFILIHKGNFEKDTEGCLLLGKTYGIAPNGNYAVWSSTQAYQEFYPIVRDAILEGKKVFIEITNDDDLVYFN